MERGRVVQVISALGGIRLVLAVRQIFVYRKWEIAYVNIILSESLLDSPVMKLRPL